MVTVKEAGMPVDGHILRALWPEYVVEACQNLSAHAEEIKIELN